MIPKPLPLILRPTPLHRLDRASDALGVDLWIKRDDLTGFALGGNKGRKLEYLVGDALARGAQAVVTCGSAQSNFIRQLAAACAVAGLRCFAAVMELPYEDAPPPLAGLKGENGNLLLDALFGAVIRKVPNGTWDELFAAGDRLACEVEGMGYAVYRIPVGGSSAFGVYAFVQAAAELPEGFGTVAFASSSGSTHAGLHLGLTPLGTRVLGFACDPEPEIAAEFAFVANGCLQLLQRSGRIEPADFDLDFSAVGPGYGVPSEEGDAAVEWLARTEGILLDPIYSGKAFGGLKRRIEEGEIRGRILFWHTGGVPALFAR